jgi:hypothetical protein
MKDILREQRTGGCRDRISGGTTEWKPRSCFFHQTRPRRTLDGSIDPTASGQFAVCGIHDRIDLLLSDVTLHKFDSAGTKLDLHLFPVTK